MRLRFIAFVISYMAFMPMGFAANQAIAQAVPNARIVGQGVLSYAFWDIYEATLYAPQGQFDMQKPFALSIKYYHPVKSQDIADKSIEEIRKLGFTNEVKLAAWHTQLKRIYPNVKNGTVLSAIYKPQQGTFFYEHNKPIGFVKEDDFSRLFFGIWLDEKTSKPKLRKMLLAKLEGNQK